MAYVLTCTFSYRESSTGIYRNVKNYLCAVSAKGAQFDTLDKADSSDAIRFGDATQAKSFQDAHNLRAYTVEVLP